MVTDTAHSLRALVSASHCHRLRPVSSTFIGQTRASGGSFAVHIVLRTSGCNTLLVSAAPRCDATHGKHRKCLDAPASGCEARMKRSASLGGLGCWVLDVLEAMLSVEKARLIHSASLAPSVCVGHFRQLLRVRPATSGVIEFYRCTHQDCTSIG